MSRPAPSPDEPRPEATPAALERPAPPTSPEAYIRRLERCTAAEAPYEDEPNADRIGAEFALLARAVGAWLRRGALELPGGYREAVDVLRFFGESAPDALQPSEIDDEVSALVRVLDSLPSATPGALSMAPKLYEPEADDPAET